MERYSDAFIVVFALFKVRSSRDVAISWDQQQLDVISEGGQLDTQERGQEMCV